MLINVNQHVAISQRYVNMCYHGVWRWEEILRPVASQHELTLETNQSHPDTELQLRAAMRVVLLRADAVCVKAVF